MHFCVLRRCSVLAGAQSKTFDLNVWSKALDLNTLLSFLVVVACFCMGCRVISAIYLNPKVLTNHLNQKVLTEHLLRQNTSQGHKSAILSCLESNDLQWPQEHKLVFSKVIGHFETLLWNKSFDLNTQNNDLSTPNKCN